jgi:hypothetical protein|tara:strand:+ start:854 stop:1066 length:213 start_codon:yes stop_codon:yes gene_type:complete
MGKKEEKYRNVGILIENHELLRELAASEDRSMVKQLGHLIKNAHEDWNRGVVVPSSATPGEHVDFFYGKG